MFGVVEDLAGFDCVLACFCRLTDLYITTFLEQVHTYFCARSATVKASEFLGPQIYSLARAPKPPATGLRFASSEARPIS